MNDILKSISLIGILPVVKISDVQKAAPLARALCEGGIPAAEITFRTAQAEEAISVISKEVPQLLVGAGTVLNIDQAERAVKAGARFIVSPGFNPKVVEYCLKHNIPVVPGCTNPSEVTQAMEYGLEAVKFFPAEASGGLKTLKALAGPFGNMKFMPTGGIDLNNLNEYLAFPKVIACGGSWMVPEKLMDENEFEKITALTREAVEHMLGLTLAHIGINCENDGQAAATAAQFADLLQLGTRNGSGSVFAGNIIELMKAPYKGTHGHIAIRTNYLDRAIYHLKQKGYAFDENSAKYDENGTLTALYLERELGGFAVHLLK